MGRIADAWRDVVDRTKPQTFTFGGRSELPEIADLLSGKAMPAGIEWERPPLSLSVYADGSLLKWYFGSGSFPKQLWGTASGLTQLIVEIEQALCKETCSWRQKKDYDNGFTRHR